MMPWIYFELLEIARERKRVNTSVNISKLKWSIWNFELQKETSKGLDLIFYSKPSTCSKCNSAFMAHLTSWSTTPISRPLWKGVYSRYMRYTIKSSSVRHTSLHEEGPNWMLPSFRHSRAGINVIMFSFASVSYNCCNANYKSSKWELEYEMKLTLNASSCW